MSTKDTVTLTDNATGKQVELPILRPTSGSPTIDISSFPKNLDTSLMTLALLRLQAATVTSLI